MEILSNALNAMWSFLWVPLVIIIGFRIISYFAQSDNQDSKNKD